MTTYRLPLFPLQVVLLPGQRLPLHIFEERYKIMIGECIEDDAPFGVVLVGKNGIHKIGCVARVTQVLEKFPDGRMNILTLGEQRFEVFRIYDNRPYFEGEVSDFHDEEGDDPTELCRMVWNALEKSESAPLNLPGELLENPFQLSFAVAEVLRLPLREKQSFLGSRSIIWRLKRLLAFLKEDKPSELALTDYDKSTHRNGH
ncbi:MAG: LON peptidase substrate-binding domain-containing protein [Nitrospinae bacterium]|nr:LON peptidase substrate-binding domain-containing protein [Nitrospinota bacterium]